MSRAGNPTISVCIPTHNRARYLAQTIEGVLAQIYPDWEIVIVDNASTDDTCSVASAYAARDQRIRYMRHDHLVPHAENFNRCIHYATGNLIAILHDDDVYEP